jgi:hypothetical protein
MPRRSGARSSRLTPAQAAVLAWLKIVFILYVVSVVQSELPPPLHSQLTDVLTDAGLYLAVRPYLPGSKPPEK